MDPKEKNLFVVNSKKNLSTEMDVLWSTKGPDFINSKSLVALCRQGSLKYFVHLEEPKTELSFQQYAPLVYAL